MRFLERGAIVGSLIGILVAAESAASSPGPRSVGMDGVLGAMLAAAIGMVVATTLWAGGTALRARHWIRCVLLTVRRASHANRRFPRRDTRENACGPDRPGSRTMEQRSRA